MKNVKIILQYEGTRYNGWQKQKNEDNTLQQVVEDAVFNAIDERVEINGSGRTDAGTHAKGQVSNFKIHQDLKPQFIMDSVNEKLPSDIKIVSCEEVEERFHARLNAKAKTYCYTVYTGKKPDVFTRRTVLHYKSSLDVEAMNRAAKYLIGEHDFMSFCSNRRTKKSTVRNLYSIDIIQCENEIAFRFRGNGFLYNMVRILTGTLLEVGLGKIEADTMPAILEARDRSKAGTTLPPRGLVLESVEY